MVLGQGFTVLSVISYKFRWQNYLTYPDSSKGIKLETDVSRQNLLKLMESSVQTGEHRLGFGLFSSSIKTTNSSARAKDLSFLLPRDPRPTVIYLMVGF